MDLVKIVGEMIELREDLKEQAKSLEWKARRLDRTIDDLMEFFKHRGLVETRRVSSEKSAPQG